MDISGLECIKDAEENWSIPGLRRGLTGLEEVFLDEIERLSKLVMEQAIDIAYLHSERDALKAALERIANVYCPNGNLARDIAEALRGKTAIDAARGE